jgi:hypothetical protein
MSLRMPVGLTPGMIGKVVSVQIIPVVPNKSDVKEEKVDRELNLEAMAKYVGKLQSYMVTPNGFGFCFEGTNETVMLLWAEHTVEFFPYETHSVQFRPPKS